MTQNPVVIPKLFKGIALFTPGGDLVYCIDPSKQGRWHSHLCSSLQDLLGLPEPPHFLIPGYTATVDRWFDHATQAIITVAELYPAVQRHQPLLNSLFAIGGLNWQTACWQEESCNPIIFETYRQQFPQLWEEHDLVVRLEKWEEEVGIEPEPRVSKRFGISPVAEVNQGYLLRLFVSGNSENTQNILKTIHQLLEQGLQNPYTLKVIDILKHPEQAEIHHIVATPTLVRVYPHPVRRIVGELEDLPRLLQIIATC